MASLLNVKMSGACRMIASVTDFAKTVTVALATGETPGQLKVMLAMHFDTRVWGREGGD